MDMLPPLWSEHMPIEFHTELSCESTTTTSIRRVRNTFDCPMSNICNAFKYPRIKQGWSLVAAGTELPGADTAGVSGMVHADSPSYPAGSRDSRYRQAAWAERELGPAAVPQEGSQRHQRWKGRSR